VAELIPTKEQPKREKSTTSKDSPPLLR